MSGEKTPPDILIEVGPEQTRVVVAENGSPVECRIERAGTRSEIGDIHLGRVKKVVPALDAAFVDIGGAAPGFLAVTPVGIHSHDRQKVREGEAIVVEVVRDAAEGKGPKLAQREDVKPEAGIRPPHILHQEPALMLRTLRDWQGPVGRILVGDMAAFGDLKRFCRDFRPDLLPKLSHCREGGVMDTDGIADRLDELLGSWVALPSGGRINIAPTAALVAIDVDTGGDSSAGTLKDTVLRVNTEAAFEIARQLRLRDVKGLVVVGFVAMRARADRERVLVALKRVTAADPGGINVGGFTRFGLVELIRRYSRKPGSSS